MSHAEPSDEIATFIKSENLKCRRPSILLKYTEPLLELRTLGHSLNTLQQYLSTKNIKVSPQYISKFLLTKTNTPPKMSYKKKAISKPIVQPKHYSKPEVIPQPLQPPAQPQIDNAVKKVGSHNPSSIDKIMRSRPDMAALAEYAKGIKK